MLAGTLEIQMIAGLVRLQQDMADAKRVVGDASEQMQRMAGGIKTAFGALGIGLSVAGIVAFVKSGVDAADALNDMSKATGITVEKLAGLKLAAKQSGGDLEGIAAAINKLSVNMGKDAERFAKLGLTAKDPLEAFKQLADVFAAIQDPQTRAALGAEVLGKSWATAAPLLAEGGQKIGEMVDKGARLAGITKEMAEQADQLNDQLAELDAVAGSAKTRLALNLVPAMTDIATAMNEAAKESGLLYTAWVGLGGVMASLLGMTDSQQLSKRLRQINEELGIANKQLAAGSLKPAGAGSGFFSFLVPDIKLTEEALNTLQIKIDALKEEKNALAPLSVDRSKEIADTKAAAAEAKKLADQFLAGADAANKRAAADKKAAEEAAKLTKEYRKLAESLVLTDAGLSPDFLDKWNKLGAAYKAGAISAQQLEDAQADLLDQQPAMKAAAKEAADMARARSDARQAEAAAIDAFEQVEQQRRISEVQAARAAVKAAQFEFDTQGLLRSQIAEVTLQRLADKQAAFIAGSENYEAVQKEIDAQKELIGILQRGEARDATTKAAKEAADEWKKTTDSIGQGLTDSLFRAFESGKDFFSTFWQGIKNLFKTTVLKLLIQPVQGAMNSLVGSVLGGLGGSATAGTGAAGGMGDMLGLGAALGSFAGGGGIFGFAGDVFGSAIGAGTSGVGAMSGIAGQIGTAIAAIPVWGWIAAGLALLAKSLDDSGTPHAGAGAFADAKTSYTTTGAALGLNYWGSDIRDARFDDPVLKTAQTVAGILNAFGSFVGKEFAVKTGYADDSSGDGGAGALSITSGGTQVAGWNVGQGDSGWGDREQGFKDYLAAVTATTRGAIDAIGLPEWAHKTLDALGGAPTLEQLAQAAQQIATVQTALTQFGDLVSPLGGVFERVAGLSGDATLQLAGFAGGMDALIAKTRSYVDAYYSEAEKAGLQAVGIKKALEAAGLATDLGSKDALRALVDSRDVATEEGRKQLAALLDVAGSFASLAEYLGKTGQTLSSLADTAPQVAMLDQTTAQADRLVAVNDSVMTIGEQITRAVATAQASAEAGTAQVALNTATLTRLIQRFDDGDALLVRVAA